MGACEGYAFWDDSIKTTITKVVFADEGFIPNKAKKVWDCSIIAGANVAKAYLCDEGKDKVLYIASTDGQLSAPASMSGFFDGFTALKSVDFSGIDTSSTYNVKKLFYNCKSLESIEWGDDAFSSSQNWSQAFSVCKSLTDFDMTEVDMSSTTNINLMFSLCDNLEQLTLPYLDEEILNECVNVFYKCGSNSDNLTIRVDRDNSMFVSELVENSTAVNSSYSLAHTTSTDRAPVLR